MLKAITQQMNNKKKASNKQAIILLGVLFFAVVFSSASFAEVDNTPIKIEADRFELIEESGRSIYEGSVLVTRGLLQLKADRIEVFTDDQRELERVVAHGKPACFRQQQNADSQQIIGQAQRIVYYERKNQVVLTGQAKIWQGRDNFSSPEVT